MNSKPHESFPPPPSRRSSCLPGQAKGQGGDYRLRHHRYQAIAPPASARKFPRRQTSRGGRPLVPGIEESDEIVQTLFLGAGG